LEGSRLLLVKRKARFTWYRYRKKENRTALRIYKILYFFLFQNLWIPDVIIHDLVTFNKPEILSEVAALEIMYNKEVYYKIRYKKEIM
jgi:hypothetical protein